MEKKVSVIMSTYNTKKEFLTKAVDSILNQKYKNLEFIIICDGSMEDYNIVKEYSDERIKLIFHNENRGLPQSLNEAIDISTGEYIMRMDSDDISLKDRISIQVEFLEKHKNIDVCGMYAKAIGEKNLIMTLFLNEPKYIAIQLLYRTCLIHPTVAFRRKIFENTDLRYNVNYTCAQDFELWTRICNNNNIAIIPKIGLKYRIHSEQASNEKKHIQEEFYKKTIKNNAKKINDDREKIENLLLVLGEKQKINDTEYIKIAEDIDLMIENCDTFNKKDLKKVFYNRYFQLMIKNKYMQKNLKKIMKNKNLRRKILKVYNIKNIIHITYYDILNIFCKY